MNLGLEGKKALIIGSTSGIGWGIAQAFRAEGAEVWLTGRDRGRLDARAGELSARKTCADLSTAEGRETLYREVSAAWPALDVLVLGFGDTQVQKPGLDSSDGEWRRIFEANFFTHVALLRLFKPLLAAARGAAVAISSIAGETRLPAPLSYSASKAAMNHFCGSAAAELAESGVRFNVVSPGNVFYPGGRWEKRQSDDPAAVKHMLETSVPLKRLGTPEEIAAFVVFLSSPRASFCTGAVVRVDGGQSPVT